MQIDHQNTLQEFQKIEAAFLEQIPDEKPLVAYLCLRVPPEAIEAAGAVPMAAPFAVLFPLS
jgi:benzoyl-CoA reductase/2-hydroxyglutaryl-CoA dehydratase subunit BcrC/BadD/HgdB